MKHTKTPWTLGKKHLCRIIGDGYQVAATCEIDNESTETRTEKANAAFIVKACNSHDALVEALGRIMAGVDNGEIKMPAQYGIQATAALDAAKAVE